MQVTVMGAGNIGLGFLGITLQPLGLNFQSAWKLIR